MYYLSEELESKELIDQMVNKNNEHISLVQNNGTDQDSTVSDSPLNKPKYQKSDAYSRITESRRLSLSLKEKENNNKRKSLMKNLINFS